MAEMIYDHPEYVSRKVFNWQTSAGASTVMRFVAHSQLMLRAIHGAVVTAGTSASSGNGVTVRVISGNGTTTTSVGSLALGTNSANYTTNTTFGTFTSAVINGTQTYVGYPLARGDTVTLTSGTDATAVSLFALEYHTLPGGTVA